MTQPNPIESNYPDTTQARVSTVQGNVGKFQSVYDAASYGASIVGPVAYASALQYAPKGADIVGAAVNSTAGYGSSYPFLTPGTYSGAGPYVSGGTPLMQTMPTSGGGSSADAIANAKAMTEETMGTGLAFLAVQQDMNSKTQILGAMTNTMSSRDRALQGIIRNVGQG